MSYKVVVVPEDPTNNGYILRPLVERVLAACGKPRANVNVLSNPRTQGYDHAKSLLREQLIVRYKNVDLLLFLPDADGKDRTHEFSVLEQSAREIGTRLLCCAAVEEVEAWLLAGHLDKLSGTPWSDVRADTSVKENAFASFLERHGDDRKPGAGREDLMRTTLKNYDGLKTRCPEIRQLELRVSELISFPRTDL
jgi:hypothetical protein